MSPSSPAGTARTPPAAADFTGVDRVLQQAVEAGRAPGVVAALTDRRRLVYAGAAGTAGNARPMRHDAVFRIASMTKLVTSVAIMMLHEDGSLDVDDPLSRRLPGFEQPGVLTSFDDTTHAFTVRPASREITLRDLLTHTSGFGYWFLNREVQLEAEGRVDYFAAPFLMHDPGARFSYGISTDVLGLVVEPVSGLALDRFMEQRIFRPLGMTSTGFDLPRDPARLAALHRRSATGFIELATEQQAEAPRGGGGLYTTAADYLALLRVLLNGGTADDGRRLLSERSVEAISTNQIGELTPERQRSAFRERTLDFDFMDGTQKFGFNVLIDTADREHGRRAASYGWGGIFNTWFWVDPATELAAVVMMQLAPFCDAGCLDVYRHVERAFYQALL